MNEVDPRLREHIAVGKTSDEEFVDAVIGLVLTDARRTRRHESER